jgi:hypothetical protein
MTAQHTTGGSKEPDAGLDQPAFALGLGTVVVLVNYRKKAGKGGRKARKAGKRERGESRTVLLAFPMQIECTSNFAATLLMLHQPY